MTFTVPERVPTAEAGEWEAIVDVTSELPFPPRKSNNKICEVHPETFAFALCINRDTGGVAWLPVSSGPALHLRGSH